MSLQTRQSNTNSNQFIHFGALFVSISFGLMSHQASAQDFYKWTDSNGSTHYTTTPPPKVKGVKQKGKVNTSGWQNNTNNSNRPPATSIDSSPTTAAPQPNAQAPNQPSSSPNTTTTAAPTTKAL